MTRKEQIGDCCGIPVCFSGVMKLATIYAIRGQNDGSVYIGSTTRSLHDRIRSHVRDAKKGSQIPVHKWMLENAHGFSVVVLAVVPEAERVTAERKWVSEVRPSLNVTDGGPGMSGHRFAGTPHALRIAASIRSGETRSCLRCGKPFWRKRNEIIKGNDKFCSRVCSNARHKGFTDVA